MASIATPPTSAPVWLGQYDDDDDDNSNKDLSCSSKISTNNNGLELNNMEEIAQQEEPTLEQVSVPVQLLTLDDPTQISSLPPNITTCITFILEPAEQQLLDLLMATVKAYQRGDLQLQSHSSSSPTEKKEEEPPRQVELRIAGGWVRDKLLHLPTHDVDLAVRYLTGVEMASLVQQYVQRTTNTAAPPKMGIIAANPDQSKHLETATMRLQGLDVDFCPLRANEVYQAHSRIPTVQMLGSPCQDAYRRDFTINALFYNLHTACLEDWTRRGLSDLFPITGPAHLVTPLPPLATFQDDPLRVLRAIRFAVRYQFPLDPVLEEAARQAHIHQALHLKVSRERVGQELEGMLSGRGAQPAKALETVAHLHLAGSVFCVPLPNTEAGIVRVYGQLGGQTYDEDQVGVDQLEAREARRQAWEQARSTLAQWAPLLAAFLPAVEARSSSSSGTEGAVTAVDARYGPLAVFVSPFRHLVYTERKKGIDKDYSVVQCMFKEGVKFKQKDVQAMTVLAEQVDEWMRFLRRHHAYQLRLAGKKLDTHHKEQKMVFTTTTAPEEVAPPSRLEVGQQLRILKELWVTGLLTAAAILMQAQQQQQRAPPPDDGSSNLSSSEPPAPEEPADWTDLSISLYQLIVYEYGLDRCWGWKPLLDGKNLIQELQLPRGPVVGRYMEEQEQWRWQHPQGTRDEALAHLRAFHAQQQQEQEPPPVSLVATTPEVGTEETAKRPSGRKEKREDLSLLHVSKRMHEGDSDPDIVTRESTSRWA